MKNSFLGLKKIAATAIWMAIIAVSAASYQAVASWHANCFTPGMTKLKSASSFPDVSELSPVGYGAIKKVTPQHTTSGPNHWTVEVFVQRKGNSKQNNLYFQDPQTRCLSKIDFKRPLLNRRSMSYELVHESAPECRARSTLGKVNLVEINPCTTNQCKRTDNDLVLFLGPEDFDGVTFSDVMFYGGEFAFNLSQKPWRSTRERSADEGKK